MASTPSDNDERRRSTPGRGWTRGPAAGLRHFRADHLLRNSVFIAMSNASQGAFGFLFWLIGARLFSTASVGVATTLITAVILIAYVSLLGFNNTFIRYLPSAENPNEQINTGLLLVTATSCLLAVAYVLVIPEFVHQLVFVRDSPGYFVGFVGVSAFSTVNLLTDSVFIAYRSAGYNLLVDGVLQSATKLTLPALLVGLAAFGLFLASGVAAFLAVVLSLVFMAKRFSYRMRPAVSRSVVRQVFHYSAGTYLADLLMITPVLFLPLIVVHRLGSSAGGYYYIALQMANVLFSISLAVSQSLFAEASYEDLWSRGLIRRSARILALTIVPGCVVLVLASHIVLSIFGHQYPAHATATLVVFALSAPAVALNLWTAALARIQLKLHILVITNGAYGLITCVLAGIWVGKGLPWVAGAWLVGNVTCSAARGVAVFSGRHTGGRSLTAAVPTAPVPL